MEGEKNATCGRNLGKKQKERSHVRKRPGCRISLTPRYSTVEAALLKASLLYPTVSKCAVFFWCLVGFGVGGLVLVGCCCVCCGCSGWQLAAQPHPAHPRAVGCCRTEYAAAFRLGLSMTCIILYYSNFICTSSNSLPSRHNNLATATPPILVMIAASMENYVVPFPPRCGQIHRTAVDGSRAMACMVSEMSLLFR